MSGYWNSPDLTFFSGAENTSGWESTLERYRKKYQSEGREMGQLEFSDLNIQELADAAFARGAWRLNMTERQNAARAVHPDLPQVSRRMENHSRSHFGRGPLDLLFGEMSDAGSTSPW